MPWWSFAVVRVADKSIGNKNYTEVVDLMVFWYNNIYVMISRSSYEMLYQLALEIIGFSLLLLQIFQVVLQTFSSLVCGRFDHLRMGALAT